MQHGEDEQPNEAVRGRHKRILPFVRDTSRIQGQRKHQLPSVFPISGESSRGHGRGHGRGRGLGRGQGKRRGRGGGLSHPPPELSRYSEANSRPALASSSSGHSLLDRSLSKEMQRLTGDPSSDPHITVARSSTPPRQTNNSSYDIDPTAKRPASKKKQSLGQFSCSSGKQQVIVKHEMEEEAAIELLQGQPTSQQQVRKHRKALKQQEIRALQDQEKHSTLAPNRISPIVILNDPKFETSRLSGKASSPTPPPPQNQPLPSHLNPIIVSTDRPSSERSSSPVTIEITCKEVPIPQRHLPRSGSIRNLEIWALEQMRLLEAELGPVVLPPPELVGIGEYLAGQEPREGARPYIRIRYKQVVRVQPQTGSTANLVIPPEYPSPTTLSSIDSTRPELPFITYIESSYSSPSSMRLHKDEIGELADNPPSPIAPPSPGQPIIKDTSTSMANFGTLDANASHEPQAAINGKSSQTTLTGHGEELDELQRLRRDLELSKLEAERKHKELEERILELSRKRPETHTPRPSEQPQPPTIVRIANEEQSSILPLRRGKYDKTRRLLAVSSSAILHVSWLGVMQLVNKGSRQIAATGFGSNPPSSISIEDACSLSPSSTALALSGHESQLAVATLGEGSFGFHPLPGKPHDAKGACSIVTVDQHSVITLGHDRRYIHWKFQSDECLTNPLVLPKLHSCTALAFNPLHNTVIAAGSESNKRSKLTLHNMVDPKHSPNTVELSNHPHHVHVDCDNPFLLLARLDDQFQVHDTRMPLYQCVQKFGYQSATHDKGEFRVRGSTKGDYFARGDASIVRLWDRRSSQSYQTLPTIPLQRVVEVVLDHTSVSCATEAHHIVTYPIV
ncbi:hypothetical protein RHS01_00539 [Rhizoctonia solani]|uniref:Uncharacterized protein n=1 Tax=Rhizoctonia solani TaxID=456999 RepID=A0A8H7IM00_9AGAM|nr:hypothetical protein RHS01_00539 [Rhizoctonia solani]